MKTNVSSNIPRVPASRGAGFSKPPAMLLYLSVLITKLCFGASLTSIEIFDVFDDIDLEFPTIDTLEITTDKVTTEHKTRATDKPTACIGNGECLGRSVDEKQLNRNLPTIPYTTTTVNDPIYNNTNNIVTIPKTKVADKYESEHQTKPNLILNVLNGTTNYDKSGALENLTIPAVPFSCPEEELPTNIGAYEVPTQRDVLLHMRTHLLSMYHGFHTKAMHFLKDVKEATQASWARKMFCRGPADLMQYRRCVRWVGDLSVLTTKNLVTALETARHQINSLIQGKICNITALSVDPIHLIRILAAEKVSLEFALPDFLRQLDACARHCPSTRLTHQQDYLKTAHLTDKDFVIRHYLTQQNYNHQLKQQYNF